MEGDTPVLSPGQRPTTTGKQTDKTRKLSCTGPDVWNTGREEVDRVRGDCYALTLSLSHTVWGYSGRKDGTKYAAAALAMGSTGSCDKASPQGGRGERK